MKPLYVIAILILVGGSFWLGSIFNRVTLPVPPTVLPVEVEYVLIYYLDQERIDRYNQHVEFLNNLIKTHEEELNRRGKTIMEMGERMGLMGFKISVYRAMTGKEIEVWSESAK